MLSVLAKLNTVSIEAEKADVCEQEENHNFIMLLEIFFIDFWLASVISPLAQPILRVYVIRLLQCTIRAASI